MVTAFNSLGRVVSQVGLQTKRHLPQIMIVSGVIGGVFTTVLACVATAKSSEVVGETQEELEVIQRNLADPDNEKYTEVEAKADKRKVYLHSAGKLAKNYAPALLVGTASIISILGGTGMLNKRNAILASSLAASIGEFEDYRKKVIEKFGEDGENIDKELRFGAKKVEITENVSDDGSVTATHEATAIVNTDFDGYRRVFTIGNPYWDKDSTYCEVFLSSRQAMFNDKLIANGYVFLNEVLEELGFPKTRVGQEVGWVFDPKNSTGDNYIDFGITPVEIVRKDGVDSYRVIENGTRNSGYLLDFNVDGSVLNKAAFPDKK